MMVVVLNIKLKYIDKIQFKWTDTIATEFGTCIHSIEEDIAKAIKAKQPIDYVGFKNRLIFKRYEQVSVSCSYTKNLNT